jgi:hypothetical protein
MYAKDWAIVSTDFVNQVVDVGVPHTDL